MGRAGSGAVEAVPACWFCSKGRHAECMREIPVAARSAGPHDCSFDTAVVPCGCGECGGGGGGSAAAPGAGPE